MKTRIPRAFFLFPVVAAVAAVLALPQAAFAQATDIAVLHSKVDHANLSIERLDDKFTEHLARLDDKFTKRFERVDDRFERLEASIVEIKENAARTDERINGLQKQVGLVVTVLIAVLVPLHLATLAALFALLTKGTFWGVARPPRASSRASRRGRPATQPVAVAP